MSVLKQIEVPITSERADENIIRIVAFEVAILSGISILIQNYFIAFFLALDFALRAFSNGNWSVLKQIARVVAKGLNISAKAIFAPPKKFAASLGVVFSLLIGILSVLDFHLAATAVGGLLIFCAILESIFSVCIGCYVYTFISKIKNKQ